MWGCTIYVLDPVLQQGYKLLKCKPRYHCRIFVVIIPNHSSGVTMILNQATGHISPQFHVIFDDPFSTVLSIYTNEGPPSL